MTEITNYKDILSKIIKYKKQFTIILSVAFAISCTISLLLPKQYKSTVVLFPTRHFSVSKLIIEQNFGNQEDYMQLGDEDDAEKLIQVLNSDALKLKVAQHLNLYKRWKIKDTTFSYHYLKLKWEDMVSIKRTEFNSVKIEAYDYTANDAAQLANTINDFCDTIKFEMTRQVAKEALIIVEKEFNHTIKMMGELEDSLQALRKLGVLDYKKEVEAYTKSLGKAIEKGNKAAIAEFEKRLDVLKNYGGNYLAVEENLKKYRFKYPVLKAHYDEALVNYNENLPFKFTVEKAKPNEYKARPKRFLIVGFSMIATFILTLLMYIIKDRFFPTTH